MPLTKCETDSKLQVIGEKRKRLSVFVWPVNRRPVGYNGFVRQQVEGSRHTRYLAAFADDEQH